MANQVTLKALAYACLSVTVATPMTVFVIPGTFAKAAVSPVVIAPRNGSTEVSGRPALTIAGTTPDLMLLLISFHKMET